ncbi:hypothetical protein BOX15_Mlig025896g1, partial [Macrostomum lignano]
YKLVDGHCLLDCHKECIDCNLAKDDTSCFQCRNVRVELKHSIGGRRVSKVQCLPECPVGYQLSDSKEKLCVPCQPGTFKNTTGNHHCLSCAPGTFSASQATVNCMLCSPGNFASKPGSVQCQQCHVGTASRFNGSASCAACSAGLFAAQRGQTECTPCPVGQFNKAERQAQCQLCSAGSFADKPGQKSCTACPAGTSSEEGSVSCANNCKRGEFSPAEGIPCAKCPAGSFTPSSGSVNCTLCSAGTFSFNPGSSECSKCPAGTYASESGSSKCHDCDLNFALKRRIGMAHCDLCPDSGSTFGTEKCHRKLRMSCEGYRYYDFLLKGCKKSIDNDLKTYGVLTYGEGISSKGEGGGSLFSRYYYKYTLDQIASVKGLISWQGDPVDSTSLEIILKDSNKNHIKNCKTKVDILNPYSVHVSALLLT